MQKRMTIQAFMEKHASYDVSNPGRIYLENGERKTMTNAMKILDQGFACLVEHMGVVDAEYFIALIKQGKFDYTVWQREYFDRFAPGEFAEKASAYAKRHPYTGKGQIL